MVHDDTAGPAPPPAGGGEDQPPAGAGEDHPSRQTLARLLSGTAQADEVQLVVLTHLTACCPACRAAVEELADLAHEYGHWDISEAITEWREAPRLWRRLAELPAGRRLAAIEADDGYWTWGLARHLQLRSAGRVGADPAGAAHLAALALRVARQLGESYDLTWVRGLRALCLACLGNARRELGEIHGAADAVAAARQLVDAGIGNPSFEAEVLLIAGLVARDRRRLDEALGLFAAARALVAPPGDEAADPGLLAAVLAQEAWCRYHRGDPGAARELLEEAERWAGRARGGDPERDPELRWGIALGRLWCALALGDVAGARGALGRAEELAAAAAAEAIEGDEATAAAEAAEASDTAEAPGTAGLPGNAAAAGGREVHGPRWAGPDATPPPAPAIEDGAAPAADGPITGRRPASRQALLHRPRARLGAASGEPQRAVEMLVQALGSLAAHGLGGDAALALLEAVALLSATGAEPSLVELVIAVIPELVASAPAGLAVADLAALLVLERECGRRPQARTSNIASIRPRAAPGAPQAPAGPLQPAGEPEAPAAPPAGTVVEARTGPAAADAADRAAPVAAESVQRLAIGIERRRRPGLAQWSAWPGLFDPAMEDGQTRR